MIWLFVGGVICGGVVGFLAARRLGSGAAHRPFLDIDADETALDEAREAIQVRVEKRKSRILAVVKAEGDITNDGVEDLYCISDRTASAYLHQLVEEGKLVRIGRGRGTHYVLPKTANPAE